MWIDRYGRDLPNDLVTRAMYEYSMSNSKQREAIQAIALGDKVGENRCYLPVIHGPPGTGKTRVLCLGSIFYLMCHRTQAKAQVIILTFTNYAADRVVETFKLMDAKPETVKRLSWVGRQPSKGIEEFQFEFKSWYELGPIERQDLSATRILVTTVDSARRCRNPTTRSLLIFDEASQINKVLLLQALGSLRGVDYVVLCGDPNQLPVVSHMEGLQESIISYLLSRRTLSGAVRVPSRITLTKQYRMHPAIMGLVNRLGAVQGVMLEADASTYNRTLAENGYLGLGVGNGQIERIFNPEKTVVLVDISDLAGTDEFDESYWNVQEEGLARAIRGIFNRIYKIPPDGGNSPILTPYGLQRSLSLQHATDESPARTVDQMQGREAELVTFSTVRSNPEGRVGFVEDFNRLYVACSRAKKKFIMIIDRKTFEGHLNFNRLFWYFEDPTEHREDGSSADYRKNIDNIRLSQESYHEILRLGGG